VGTIKQEHTTQQEIIPFNWLQTLTELKVATIQQMLSCMFYQVLMLILISTETMIAIA
tara:strand:- start:130 stop:303 length:174 start_codon:yes stop_codon:yes gene_type:complete